MKDMQLQDINTYNELSDYLLERMDYADDDISKANSSFTKEQMWNMYIGECLKWENQDLPIRTKNLLLKTIKKDFNHK